MKKKTMVTRMTAMFLAIICVLGLFPASAFAAGSDTIKLERLGMSGVSYTSDALGKCTLHQMYFDCSGKSTIGFCAEKGKSMGNSLTGQTWGNPTAINDPTVKKMMAYYYAHSTGVFTDQAHALGVDDIWDSGYTWYMNAWVQAIVWRFKEGSLGNPVEACAQELMAVWNSLEGTHYTSIDQKHQGSSFRDRTQYILDLGNQGVWGECEIQEYQFTGAGSDTHPSSSVQAVMLGELIVDHENLECNLVIKKVDSSNPTKGLPGAKFHVESTTGSYSKDVVTGSDGTYTLKPLDPGTYAVTEVEAPNGYKIDNAGPVYVVLPNGQEKTVTVTFTDTPEVTASGSIRKVDADNPTHGLAGAVIKIEGVDNNFVGTYTTVEGGALADVPWDTMPVGSFTATEVTPPNGYDLSKDPNKVKQSFRWDGKSDVNLVFENDSRVKVQLIKKDDSDRPLAGAVFNILKDGQLIGSEATNEQGIITVSNVSEGLYAFVEVSAPKGFAKLSEPVIAHVDQATVNGGGTVTVTATNHKLPNLTIKKLDAQTKEPVPNTVFDIKGIHYDYRSEVTTNAQGEAVLTGIPVDSYEVTEKSVPAPYVVGDEPMQTIYLGPGDNRELIFENLKEPVLTIKKIDAVDHKPVPGTVFTVEGINSDYKHDFTTGEDGTVELQVAPGTYKVTEKSVPAPYYLPDLDKDRSQEISLNPGDNKELIFKNHKMPELIIYKEDSVAGAPIEGAKFHVTYTSNGESKDAPATIDFGYIFTDSKGEIRLHEQGKRLYPGEYTVTEVAPAPGFQMKEPLVQKVILHGSESKTLTFQNEPLNAIIVEKYDSVTHEALPGCTFQLKYLGGTSGTGGTIIGQKVTGKNGTAIWTGLKAGTYIVEEVDPADGYNIIQSSETIYLQDTGVQSVVTVRFENLPDGVLLVRKVCSVNPSITLANAEFKITYADGTLIGDSNGIYRTDENGEIRIEGLTPGKSVIVTETKAPDGFIIDTQSQTIQIKGGKVNVLTFKNQPKGSIIIQKRDSATGKPLPGAEFRVTTAAGCEVGLNGVIGDSTLTQNGIFTTDSNGEIKITGLAPGAFIVHEIKAPEGYVIDQPSTNVVIGGKGDVQTVVIKNSKAGQLVIMKQDSLTGKPLAGVQFKVTTATGEYVPDENGYISSNGLYFTDKDGKITINGVVGTLVVTETKTIPGYSIDPGTQTQTVVVHPNDVQTLHFYNTPSTTLTIEKYVAGTENEPLKGVKFLVTDSSGAAVGQSNGEYITDETGRIVIHDLTPGTTVTAREIETVEGYVLDGTPKSILIKEGEAQTLRFYNHKQGSLVIQKKCSQTGQPLSGVEFQLTYADGGFVDDAHGHLSSKGLYTTDKNGEIRISGITGTVVVKETKTIPGYTIDPATQTQTVEINAADTQTLTFYNDPIGGIEILKINEDDRTERIPNTTFEIRKMDDELVSTVTTDKNGRAFVSLKDGSYYAKEIKSAEGFRLDDTPHYFEVENGKTSQLVVTNKANSGIIIHKIDSVTENGIYGVKFVLYDRNHKPIGEYTTDNEGYIYIDEIPGGLSGRFYLRELEAAPGYELDKQYKSVHVHPGKTIEIEWENTPITGQIQLTKYAAEFNTVTGTAPGAPLKGAVYEIINPRNNKVVDHITTDARGIAASRPLPLGRYQLREVTAPAYWQVDTTVHDVTLEYPGQIIKLSAFDKAAKLGVSITKRGNTSVLAGSQMRYNITVANTSNVDLSKFFWHDRIPTDIARATVLSTGTYSARLNYRVLYKTNYSANYQVLASNLLTSNNYTFALNAIPMQAGEVITDVYFDFGKVPVGFQSVTHPTLSVMVNGRAVNGYQMVNRADVGGFYGGTWQTSNASWVTIIQRLWKVPSLPKTGY